MTDTLRRFGPTSGMLLDRQFALVGQYNLNRPPESQMHLREQSCGCPSNERGMAFSGATCIARQPIGAVYEHAQALAFMRELLNENVAVAQARGMDFDSTECDRVIALFGSQPYEQKSSMLVDLEGGRALELQWLSGRVCALGEELGVATPANRAVCAALAPYIGGAGAN